MRYAMDLCVDEDCALQLHTESEPDTFESISDIAREQSTCPPGGRSSTSRRRRCGNASRSTSSLRSLPGRARWNRHCPRAPGSCWRPITLTTRKDPVLSWGRKRFHGRRKRPFGTACRKKSSLRYTRKILRSATGLKLSYRIVNLCYLVITAFVFAGRARSCFLLTQML